MTVPPMPDFTNEGTALGGSCAAAFTRFWELPRSPMDGSNSTLDQVVDDHVYGDEVNQAQLIRVLGDAMSNEWGVGGWQPSLGPGASFEEALRNLVRFGVIQALCRESPETQREDDRRRALANALREFEERQEPQSRDRSREAAAAE